MNVKRKVLDLYVWVSRMRGKKVIHFIHIGKTAGTAIKKSFSDRATVSGNLYVSNTHIFMLHGHGFRFNAVSENESAFFVVRDPVQRFVSGFYSRMRMGRPLNYNPWTPGEEKAFQKFASPDELGIALNSTDANLRSEAEAAMRNIGHVNSSYWDWFINEAFLLGNLHKIDCVLVQEELREDFARFSRKHNLPMTELPKDAVVSHKNPEGLNKRLSDAAIKNLRVWYQRDYDFLEFLFQKQLIKKQYV